MAKYTRQQYLAWIFIIPQLVVILLFFIWPSCKALIQSLFFSDPFGMHSHFAGFTNFMDLLADPNYKQAIVVTFIMVFFISLITMSFGLLMAYLVSQRKKSQMFYKTMMLWPYAVAPAVAAILWRFLCHPNLGWIPQLLSHFGITFNYINSAAQSMAVIILSASWQHFSYNFLFYFAAMAAIPQHLIDAAILDGASANKRFWDIIFPLLSPTTFFLLIMNMIYGFFETFGIIHVVTHGGPGVSTTNMIFKVYEDGFTGMDAGSSSAQSVILMAVVVGLTLLQFNYLEKKVHYE